LNHLYKNLKNTIFIRIIGNIKEFLNLLGFGVVFKLESEIHHRHLLPGDVCGSGIGLKKDGRLMTMIFGLWWSW